MSIQGWIFSIEKTSPVLHSASSDSSDTVFYPISYKMKFLISQIDITVYQYQCIPI